MKVKPGVNTAVIRLTGDDTASVTVEETPAVSYDDPSLDYSTDGVLLVPAVWKTIEFGGVWFPTGR